MYVPRGSFFYPYSFRQSRMTARCLTFLPTAVRVVGTGLIRIAFPMLYFGNGKYFFPPSILHIMQRIFIYIPCRITRASYLNAVACMQLNQSLFVLSVFTIRYRQCDASKEGSSSITYLNALVSSPYPLSSVTLPNLTSIPINIKGSY